MNSEMAYCNCTLMVIGFKISRQFINQSAKTNRDLHVPFFPRFEQITWNVATNLVGLFHCAVCTCCEWSTVLLWDLFYDTQLKTAL